MVWCTGNLLQSPATKQYNNNCTKSQIGNKSEGGKESKPVDGSAHQGVDHDAYKEIQGHINGIYKGLFIRIQFLYYCQHYSSGSEDEKSQRKQNRKDPESFQVQE